MFIFVWLETRNSFVILMLGEAATFNGFDIIKIYLCLLDNQTKIVFKVSKFWK